MCSYRCGAKIRGCMHDAGGRRCRTHRTAAKIQHPKRGLGTVTTVAPREWHYACRHGEHRIVLATDPQHSRRWTIGSLVGQPATCEESARAQNRPQRCPLAGALIAAWVDPAEFYSRPGDSPATRFDA